VVARLRADDQELLSSRENRVRTLIVVGNKAGIVEAFAPREEADNN
jgi:hypothetical protein